MVWILDWSSTKLTRIVKSKMVISVNDLPRIRKAFDGLPISAVEITYTVGGKNKSAKRGKSIIRNF